MYEPHSIKLAQGHAQKAFEEAKKMVEAAGKKFEQMFPQWKVKPKPVEESPLRLAEKEIPVPNTDELLIKISACGICRTDLHVCEGELEPRLENVIPGHQIVGRIFEKGGEGRDFEIGERVGVAWLNRTCGKCNYCLKEKENLCENADFTGWTVNGGFAEYAVASSAFTCRLPENFSGLQAAPLLCAGIIGYRALRLTGIENWQNSKLGIYGFGATGHVCIQIAKSRGAKVLVINQD